MTHHQAPVYELISGLARMPVDHINGLAQGLDQIRDLSDQRQVSDVVARIPAAWRQQVGWLISEAAAIAGVWSPKALASALQAAAMTCRQVEDEERVELAWTGPSSLASTFRRTDRAWVETIEGANESMWIASFTVGAIGTIEEALVRVLERGVVVSLLFETAADSSGYLTSNGYERFSPSIKSLARFFRWPVNRRDCDDRGNVGIMHAKCVVADRSVLFVSSANLSGAALERNLEVGVVLRGGRLPGWLASRFDDLVRHGIVEQFTP